MCDIYFWEPLGIVSIGILINLYKTGSSCQCYIQELQKTLLVSPHYIFNRI